MRFDKCVCSSSRELAWWAVEGRSTLFIASLIVSVVLAAVWVLVETLVVVSKVVVARVGAIDDDDVAIALGGPRFGMGVWGRSWRELGCLGGVLDCRWGSLG